MNSQIIAYFSTTRFFIDPKLETEYPNQSKLEMDRKEKMKIVKAAAAGMSNVSSTNNPIYVNFQSKCTDLISHMIGEIENIYKTNTLQISIKQDEYLQGFIGDVRILSTYTSMVETQISMYRAIDSSLDSMLSTITSLSVDEVLKIFNNRSKAAAAESKGTKQLRDRYRKSSKLPPTLTKNRALQKIDKTILANRFNKLVTIRVLLEGPAGIGKTLASKYIHSVWSTNPDYYYEVNSSNTLDMYRGVAEDSLRDLLVYFMEHPHEKGVLLLDEADEYMGKGNNSSIKIEIQTALGEVSNLRNLAIVMATNYIERIDTPIQSRFEVINYDRPTTDELKEYILNLLDLDPNHPVYNGLSSQWTRLIKANEITDYRKAQIVFETVSKKIQETLSQPMQVTVSSNRKYILIFSIINSIKDVPIKDPPSVLNFNVKENGSALHELDPKRVFRVTLSNEAVQNLNKATVSGVEYGMINAY